MMCVWQDILCLSFHSYIPAYIDLNVVISEEIRITNDRDFMFDCHRNAGYTYVCITHNTVILAYNGPIVDGTTYTYTL